MTIKRVETAINVSDPTGIFFRGKAYNKILAIKSVGAGKFEITTRNGVYKLEGGKKLGGSRSDWFLEGPHIGTDSKGRPYMVMKGLMDTLHLLEHEL